VSVRAARLQARGGPHSGIVQTRGQRRRRRGLGQHASVRDHALAPPGARSQHAIADEEVGFRPGRHRRQNVPGIPTARTPAPECRRARPSSTRARRGRHSAAAGAPARRADAIHIGRDALAPLDRSPTPTRWRRGDKRGTLISVNDLELVVPGGEAAKMELREQAMVPRLRRRRRFPVGFRHCCFSRSASENQGAEEGPFNAGDRPAS
jgi:hypothetical protein